MSAIRQIGPADILDFVPLYQNIFPKKNITEKNVEGIFCNEPATVFVAGEHKKFVGFIYFLTILDEIEIIDVGVHANFRKQGIGKKLMQHVIHHAQIKNIKRILLEVRADNVAAIHLYESLGFIFIRSRSNYYEDGCDAWVYESRSLQNSHVPSSSLPMPKHFLDGLDADLKKSLKEQLRVLWAHTSTAIEGNSLTLGETHQVLTEGLTISGKPLKDHNEVTGHAHAEDLMEASLKSTRDFTKEDLFELHKAIQTKIISDVYEPIGFWKNQPNSTVVIIGERQVINDTYASVEDVEPLMTLWLKQLNFFKDKSKDPLGAYVWLHAGFVRIHPFADGNGRLARLVSNIPVLKSGEPPLIIPKESRLEYIRLLGEWQLSIGRPNPAEDLVVENKNYKEFFAFCKKSWDPAKKFVEEARRLQGKR